MGVCVCRSALPSTLFHPWKFHGPQWASLEIANLSKCTAQHAFKPSKMNFGCRFSKPFEKVGPNPGLIKLHAQFHLHIWHFYATSQTLMWTGPQRRKWEITLWSCAEKSNWAASSLRSHLISFWSLQLWMLLSQLQNETQRLHQKPSCLSDAASCNTGQLRWMLRPLRSCWKRLAFFFSHFYSIVSLSIRRRLSCCTVDSHWVEPWKEEICRHNANHIIIFLPSLSDRKNSWRAWIVLRIPFQPLSHSGPRSLCG